jgi:acyl-CoA synthetase (AMP-forming)/AMP-acid ligase II
MLRPDDSPHTLRDVIVDRSRTDPDRLAYDDGSRTVTFGELAERAAAGAALLASKGVKAGDRVALVLPAGVEFAEAFWAVQMLGATSCAFNPGLPARTIERRTARIRPRLVVTEGMVGSAAPVRDVPDEPPVGGDDIAFFQPTSGTSGEPRAAMLRHRNVLTYLGTDLADGHAGRDDVFVAWVPPWHDLGLVRFVIGCAYYAAACHIVKPAVHTIPLWLETITRVRGTLTGGPDFSFRLAARMVDPASVDITSLRFATNGGEPVSLATVERFEERFGLSGVVMPGYGLAEATLGVSSHLSGEPLVADERGNVACGRARRGVELRIQRDGDGDDSPAGEILVRGGEVFAGYFDEPEETRAALRDGWLHTGDIGYLDDEARLYVLGRRPAMIKRGGGVVAPHELEEAAEEVAGVRLAAAVGIRGEDAVSDVVTLVVEADPAGVPTAEALAADVSRAVTSALRFAPGQVLVVPPRTIPMTENGKVRHARLRSLLLEGAIGVAA